MSQPLVSVVIPAFNGEAFVAQAIESALGQDYPAFEVIVVDDGSSDRTAECARLGGAQLVVAHDSNRGIGAARNTGVAHASGEYLAFLDADDLWPPGRTAALIAALERDPAAHAVVGSTTQFGEGRPETQMQAGVLAGATFIRSIWFERVGPFDETLRVGEFIDWWARAIDLGMRAVTIPDVVLHRRIHTTNTGISRRDDRVDYTRVLRSALLRRRGGA